MIAERTLDLLGEVRREVEVADPTLLERAMDLFINAPDRSAAVEQLRSLLSPSN